MGLLLQTPSTNKGSLAVGMLSVVQHTYNMISTMPSTSTHVAHAAMYAMQCLHSKVHNDYVIRLLPTLRGIITLVMNTEGPQPSPKARENRRLKKSIEGPTPEVLKLQTTKT